MMEMTKENEDFVRRWENTVKEQKRVSFPKEALSFINQRAFDDFGFTRSAFSQEVCKLILIAKGCIEKDESTE